VDWCDDGLDVLFVIVVLVVPCAPPRRQRKQLGPSCDPGPCCRGSPPDASCPTSRTRKCPISWRRWRRPGRGAAPSAARRGTADLGDTLGLVARDR
jgi:hypothetical protein